MTDIADDAVSAPPPDWWTEHLAAAAAGGGVPVDHHPSVMTARDEDVAPIPWPDTLEQDLTRLSGRFRTELPVVVIAGLLVLVGRYAGRADLVVGWIAPGSASSGAVRMLRIRGAEDATFAEFLTRVGGELCAGPAREAAQGEQRTPNGEGRDGPRLTIGFGAVPADAPTGSRGAGIAPFDIFLEISGPMARHVPRLRYRSELFDQATMRRMADHLSGLLRAVADNPGAAVTQLPIISDAELTTVTVILARGTDAEEQTSTIAELFEHQVQRAPGALAVECGTERLTYAQLNTAAGRLAGRLATHGLGPGSLCGVFLGRSLGRLVALLAIAKTGSGYLPMEPENPRERIAAIIRDASPRVIVTSTGLRDRLPAGAEPVLLVDAAPGAPSAAVPDQLPRAHPADLAYVMYTSGSTGRPKGVMVEQRCVTGFLAGIKDRVRLGPGVRMLQFAGITFDSTICEIFGPLLSGGAVVIPPPDVDIAGPGLLDFLRKAEVTTALLPPSLLCVLPDAQLPALHTLIVGGEVVPSSVFARWGRRRFLVGYGPTETTLIACIGDRLLPDRPPPIGRPLPGVEIYVLDEAMSPVPPGIPGEIWIGGGNLARGYLGSAALTADCFRPHPFARRPGARLYRTGDLGRWLPGGELEFLGRADGQIKVRGHRVELGEVERTITALCGVRECAVVPQGSGVDLRLVAFATGADLDPAWLLRRLAELLPSPMVPSAIVPLDRLPVAPHGGKVDRGGLRELLATAFTQQAPGTLPADPVERRIAQVWADVLGIASVGRADGFVLLGGNSLQATRVLAILREEAGYHLSLREFFDAGTVGGVAALVTQPAARTSATAPLPPVVRDGDAAGRPSLGQQRLWFLSRLSDWAGAAYNVPVVTRLRGPLEVAALRVALDAVTQRNEALRTGFTLLGGELATIVSDDARVRLQIVDVTGQPSPAATATRMAAKDAARPFDLSRPPLVRARLIRLADDDHLLVLVVAHVVCDAWSIDVLDRQLAAAYSAARAGDSPQRFPEPTLRYRDFANWQRKLEDSDSLRESRRYWREQLRGVPGSLRLPADHPGPDTPSHRGGRITRKVPGALLDAVSELARQEETTPYVVFLTALGALIHRLGGQEDMVIGSPAAGRPSPGLDDVTGFFVNTVPLRLQVRGGSSLRETVRRSAQVVLDAIEHQYVPFEWLARELGGRDGSGHPPVEVVLAYQGPRRPHARIDGLDCEPVPVDNGTAKFALTVEIDELPGELACALEYSTDLFAPRTAKCLLDWYVRLLAEGMARPDMPLRDLSFLNRGELAIVGAEPAGDAAARSARCIHELFAERAAQSPHRIAVTDGDRCLTYQELDRAANRLAHVLRRHGAGPEVLVAVWAERASGTVVALLAVLKSGSGYLPLDPSHPPARLSAAVNGSGCPILVGPERARSVLPQSAVFVSLDDMPGTDDGPGSSQPPRTGVRAGNVAYVIYTSGSTGKPKGVMVTHANASRLFTATEPTVGPRSDDVWTLFHSFAFDFSVWELWGALLYGGRLVIVPYPTSRDPESFLRLVAAEQVTILSQTPAAFRRLVQEAESSGFPDTRLRLVVFGGEKLEQALLRPWIEHYGDAGPRLLNMYGITETTVHVTQRVMTRRDLGRTVSPIGRPLPDLSVYLLDEHLHPVPVRTIGEMYVGGAGVSRGYLGQAALTAERFMPDPVGPRCSRMYRTGDLALLTPDGDLIFCGRSDEQVQLRGFRIEPGEVEAALLDQPSVREAAVVLRTDQQGEGQLIGYVVTIVGDTDEAALRAALARRLPSYMVPSRFVAVTALPVTVNGKLDKEALPDPVTDRAAAAFPGHRAAPATKVEHELVRILAGALGRDGVATADNFFALGGDSIIAIRVVARAREAGLAIGVEDLYRQPTVAGLGALCEQRRLEPAGQQAPDGPGAQRRGDARPAELQESYPATSMQVGIIYECEISEDPTLYHDLTSVRLSGPLDYAALRRALDLLSRRHDILRTSFDLDACPEPLQLLHQEAPIPLLTEVLAAGRDHRSAARAWWKKQWQRAFDLSKAPLARCHVLEHSDGTYQIALSLHHAIADGWSFSVLIGDLLCAYDAQLGGPVQLARPPRVRFRDFVALERAALDSAAARRFWTDRAAAAQRTPPWAGLGRGPQRAPGVDPDVRAVVPPGLVDRIRGVADSLRVPAKSVFLAAHLWMLGELGGHGDVTAGIVVNGRPEEEGSDRIAGLFLNCLPLRAQLDGRTWSELIGAAFDGERELLPYRRYPLAHVQAAAGAPLFAAMFNYADFHAFDRLRGLRVIRPLDWWFSDRTNFALDVELARRPLSGVFDLSVRVDPARADPTIAPQAARLYQWALERMVCDPQARCPAPGAMEGNPA